MAMSMRADVCFTRADALRYDRHCMQELGLAGVVLMERAARGCADLALEMAGAGRVVVACGPGQNGGDGYAIARMLRDAGRQVVVVALGAPREGSDAAEMRARLQGVSIVSFEAGLAVPDASLVVDALFGTGLDRPLAADALGAVRWVNAIAAPVLSVDLPSGLDCDRGVPLPECVRATVTATMVAPKAGFAAARAWTGRVEVVSLGGPEPAGWLLGA